MTAHPAYDSESEDPIQFHTLPEHAREALIERAVQLVDQPWDAAVRHSD